jgi:hypothetical protein
MGIMDKVKAQANVLADKAQTGMQQGQTKLQEMQAGKQVDHLLRELGAHVFLNERGRDQPDGATKVAGIMDQLDALEAAGTAVTVTPDPAAPPPGGAVPQASTPPTSTQTPPPPAASGPTTVPQTAPAPPTTGSAIPQSGSALPGQ